MNEFLRLNLRRQQSRQPSSVGRAGWLTTEATALWPVDQSAIIVVDMWDRHWSRGASERVEVLAPRINNVLEAARRCGVHIIHAPSDVVGFYDRHPARRNALGVPALSLPTLAEHADPPLPIDDSDEGSDTGESVAQVVWTRQHPAIAIHDQDSISADDGEILAFLKTRGIQRLLYMGVHLNMCVLHRPFGIKRMVRWGYDVALARDLTDTMYNPMRPPYVSHDQGTQLVVQFVEKFWCPSFSSDDLT